MKGQLTFNPDVCSGCNTCSTICSVTHFNIINTKRSRIKVLRKEEDNLDVVNVCVQCNEKYCIQSCPTKPKSLSINPQTGAIDVNYNTCIKCGLCIKACPYGGISMDLSLKNIIVCDLCGGDPQCVKYCPTNAIQFLPSLLNEYSEKENEKIKDLTKQILGNMLKNPSNISFSQYIKIKIKKSNK
ncbi:MAG: 4Fe-4S dicluster domain-containing protein [Caldisphaera sp.]